MIDLKLHIEPEKMVEITKTADEIGYSPAGRQELRRFAEALSEKPLPIGMLGASIDLLKQFLVEHLPGLAPTATHEMEDLKSDIVAAAAGIGFRGREWDNLAEELNKEEIFHYEGLAWRPYELKDYCRKQFEDFDDLVGREILEIEARCGNPTLKNGLSLEQLLLPGSSCAFTECNDESYTGVYCFDHNEEHNRVRKDYRFKMKLSELINRFDIESDRDMIPITDYFKWKTQAQWFLHQSLGPNNSYTREFTATMGRDLDPYSNAREIMAGKGILEALMEDYSQGWLILGSESGYH
jgi:hypothetical protein